VEELGGSRDARTTVVHRETFRVGVGQPERLESLAELVRLISGVDIDPQKTLRSERADDLLGQLDAPVGGIRVEEADDEVAQWR
jgi:hypothetical protein